MQERIHEKLANTFAPTVLEIRNDSHLHAGHAGSPNSGQSHFHVTMKSSALDGLSRVAQQRKIYQVLAEEMASGVHALGITVLS